MEIVCKYIFILEDHNYSKTFKHILLIYIEKIAEYFQFLFVFI